MHPVCGCMYTSLVISGTTEHQDCAHYGHHFHVREPVYGIYKCTGVTDFISSLRKYKSSRYSSRQHDALHVSIKWKCSRME